MRHYFVIMIFCLPGLLAAQIQIDEADVAGFSTASEGDYYITSQMGYLYLGMADGTLLPISHNIVTDELIFDGEDDLEPTNDDFYYVSLILNGQWKVIRYDKTDVNLEEEATEDNNPAQTDQPTTLAVCALLTFTANP